MATKMNDMDFEGLELLTGGVRVGGVPLFSGGLPFPGRGKYFFCDPSNGSSSFDGLAPDRAKDTLAACHTLATAGNNDVVVLLGDGTTTATARQSSTLVWSKNATHLVGIAAPTRIAQRARISTASGASTNVNPLVQVTGNGCMLLNFSLFQGVGEAGTAEQLWSDEGERNYYENIHFGGMGGVAGADHVDSYCLRLYGGGERTFVGCTIGLDSRARGAANTSLQLRKNGGLTPATRDMFISCIFPALVDATTPVFIDVNEQGAIDRFTWFKNCMFHSAINSGGSSMDAVVAFNASQGGTVLMDNCTVVGADDWTASDTGLVRIAGPVPNGDTSGFALSADTT